MDNLQSLKHTHKTLIASISIYMYITDLAHTLYYISYLHTQLSVNVSDSSMTFTGHGTPRPRCIGTHAWTEKEL